MIVQKFAKCQFLKDFLLKIIKMRGKIQPHSKEQKIQKLLDKQIELEAELQRCQDNLDLFEEYYLQTSWRTGNIFLGWPICTYNDITEFINRPRAKKNTKPYVQVAEHEKIFSLSSVSSRPFINVSKVNYLATKDLHLEGRQRIPRLGNQGKKNKLPNEKPQKLEKIEYQSKGSLKEEEDQQSSNKIKQESDSSEEESKIQNSDQKALKVESSEGQESEIESSSNAEQQSSQEKSEESDEMPEKIIEQKFITTTSKVRNQQKPVFNNQKTLTYFHRNQKRTISVPSQSESS